MSLPDTKRLIFRKFINEHTKMIIGMAIRSRPGINSEFNAG